MKPRIAWTRKTRRSNPDGEISPSLADGEKILTVLFFIAVVVLLVVYAQKIDWQEVWKVIRDYNRTALLSTIGLVIASYLIYGCYDLLGRAYCAQAG